MSNTILKYQFQATYKDGTVYIQNKEDVSITEPEKRSCYFDVMQSIKIGEETIKGEDGAEDRVVDVYDWSKLQSFFVFNDEHTYSVNLEDGHFEVDGLPFLMHTDPEIAGFRLVYYRQHTHNMYQETGKEISHDVVFCLGWQATDKNGKNVQRIMTIN